MILIDRIDAIREDDENMKCAVCGKEIESGCVVERECLEKLIKERDRWEELAQIGAQNCQFDCEERKELERLKAENKSLKLRIGEK